MEQTRLIEQERPLLKYAISKLNPDIFSHPVWVWFGRQRGKNAISIAEQLSSAIEGLEPIDTGSTCQILLVCAVYQNLAGQNSLALATLDRILDLASRTEFTPGVIWGHWGACAISFQTEQYGRAVLHLEDLETVLNREQEWILADFVDVIKQSLCEPEMVCTWRQTYGLNGSSGNLLHVAYFWLQQWGVSFQALEPAGRSKWDHWHAPEFFHKWELKLNDNSKERKQLTVWQSVRSLLRLQEYDRRRAPHTGQEEIQQKVTEIVPQVISPEKSQEPGINLSASDTNLPKLKGIRKATSGSRKKPDRICLTVQMLGPFSMTIGETLSRLPASRALSVFKYLLLHHSQSIPREVLMDIFWPEAGPEAARNNLNVAIHNMRQALRSVTRIPVISFDEGSYRLVSNLDIWLDVDEFAHCIKEGKKFESVNQLTAAVAEYEIAINLYRGDLLADSPYEEWMVLDRERLRVAYLDILDHLCRIYFNQEKYAACITVCQLILSQDRCCEDAHCILMRCYSRQGQYHLALRQYQSCVDVLRAELDVTPAAETTQIYEQLRRREHI
jgi:DNA-binding SARP family transcriptional activator